MEYTQTYDSPFGPILLASDGQALTGLWFQVGHRYLAHSLDPNAQEGNADLPIFAQTKAWLDAYFGNPGVDPGPIPPVNPQVTPFRKEVCGIMAKIPYGATVTYGQIAEELANRHGKKSSARAVGGAVGHNPVSIIIPCHRVVGAGGNLTGYGGGMKRKVALLELEGFDMDQFTIPTKGTAL